MANDTKIILKANEEKEIAQGFPWVFDNEISNLESLNDSVKDGDIIEVYSKKGAFLGSAVINRKSKITLRMISLLHKDKIVCDLKSFWQKKISDAVNMRRMFYKDSESYRLVFAEADLIPGFICERYVSDGNVYLVVQFLALACEVFRNEILSALTSLCKPYGIYERSDAAVREKEGLTQRSGWIGKVCSEVIQIEENGIKLNVDIARGQKTGYFLDQKFNRERIKMFCKGKRVLDTFTHTGAFGLNAFLGGAREVISCDISEEAVSMVNKNIQLNKAEGVVSCVCADVFDLLKKYEDEKQKFDVIILDPPAFAKSASSVQKAYGGYKEINLRAMRLLNEGGILISCSCSHFFDENKFYSMLMHAAMDSHKKLQVLEKRGAGPDHPLLMGYPKSEYLKCAICRVI